MAVNHPAAPGAKQPNKEIFIRIICDFKTLFPFRRDYSGEETGSFSSCSATILTRLPEQEKGWQFRSQTTRADDKPIAYSFRL